MTLTSLHPLRSLIRYPGSKDRIAGRIIDSFPWSVRGELFGTPSVYCEPFFGAGAIGWRYLKQVSAKRTRVVVNDIDHGMACLWTAVRDSPGELERMVADFKPTTDAFYLFKQEDGRRDIDPVTAGFRKLALHRMSFSGLGYMSGGPLGGRKQRSEYNTKCRWNPEVIRLALRQRHRIMQQFGRDRFEIRCDDFANVLATLPPGSFAYLDPPYYVQGSALYRHAMSEEDHVRLAALARDASFCWALSYDDHPRIRELYAGFLTVGFEMKPTVQTERRGSRRKNREIVITNC